MVGVENMSYIYHDIEFETEKERMEYCRYEDYIRGIKNGHTGYFLQISAEQFLKYLSKSLYHYARQQKINSYKTYRMFLLLDCLEPSIYDSYLMKTVVEYRKEEFSMGNEIQIIKNRSSSDYDNFINDVERLYSDSHFDIINFSFKKAFFNNQLNSNYMKVIVNNL